MEMENAEKKIKENYANNLKVPEFVQATEIDLGRDLDFHRFPLSNFYNVLRSEKFRGTKLLEIGSGTHVHYVALASGFYSNIIMSDYVEDLCENLKGWLEGQPTVKQFLDIPVELEGYCGELEAGKELVANRVRKTVKQVVRCDLLTDDILLEEVHPEVAPPYDLITSALCVESSVPDYDGFVLALKRISRLLRPGGGLHLVGLLEAGPWYAGSTEYHYIKISEGNVKKALKESGFGNIDMKIRGKLSLVSDHEAVYCLFAEKEDKLGLRV